MLERIESTFKKLDVSNKRRAVLITTTAFNDNPDFYVASAKESASTLCLHFIVRNKQWLSAIVDNSKKYNAELFVDAEIKTSYKTLVKDVSEVASGLKFHTIKPNDYTCQAIEATADFFYSNPLELDVWIFGVGNLGMKAAARFYEKGATVHLVSRSREKAQEAAEALERVAESHGKLLPTTYDDVAINGRALLLGCTSGHASIQKSFVEGLSEDSLVMDVGQRNIPEDSLAVLNDRGIRVLSLFAGEFLIHQVDATLDLQNKIASLKSKDLDGERGRLIEPGIIGAKGDILVNNVENVTNIIGVCDGTGDLLRKEEADLYIKKAGLLS